MRKNIHNNILKTEFKKYAILFISGFSIGFSFTCQSWFTSSLCLAFAFLLADNFLIYKHYENSATIPRA